VLNRYIFVPSGIRSVATSAQNFSALSTIDHAIIT
jgi:hypothetical protein